MFRTPSPEMVIEKKKEIRVRRCMDIFLIKKDVVR